MIEINLLPGAQKRKKRAVSGGFSLKLPENLPAFDRMMAFTVAAWIIGPLALAWLYFGVQGTISERQAAVDVAVADSTRYAQLISTQTSLRARQDTIAQKLAIIQEIDAGRYIWPHLMDEVSRALPDYTWLQAMDQIGGGPTPQFQMEGRTGSLPALTRFMDNLEASPFIRDVQLVTSEQAQIEGNRIVNNFVLTGRYETPPMEVIETVPLFEGMTPDSGALTMEAANGAGTS